MFSVPQKMLFFPSHFSNDIYKCLNVTSGDEFFLKRNGAPKTQDDLMTWEIKLKKHTWNIDPFRWTPLNIKKNKQTNWVWKMHAFRLVNIVAFTALVQLNNLYNNRFFNAYSMGCLSLTLCFIDTMVITDWATNF